MSITINVYLNNEDDVESLAASLKKYNIRNESREEIPEDDDRDMRIIPAAGVGGGSGGGTTSGAAFPAVLGSFSSFKSMMKGSKDNSQKYPNFLLSFDVEEDRKEEVLEEIRKTDGYIDKSITE